MRAHYGAVQVENSKKELQQAKVVAQELSALKGVHGAQVDTTSDRRRTELLPQVASARKSEEQLKQLTARYEKLQVGSED